MLTIGALVILSILTLNYYGSVARSGNNLSQSQAGFFATTLATSYIERAQNTHFDAVTSHIDSVSADSVINNPNILTKPVNLHREDLTREDSIQNFDDFDDFNGFTDITTPGGMLGTFTATFRVYYVSPTGIDSEVNFQTFVKRMDIKVWRSYPPIDPEQGTPFDTARISCIMGYFKFK